MLIKPRKCRATDQGEEGPRRKVRTMWDVDSSRTSALLEDMGVSVLPSTNTEQQTMFVDSDEEDQEMSSPPNQYPTPEILVVQNCQPPPAPKVSHLVSCGNNNNLVEYEYMGGISDVSPVYTVMDIVQPIITSPNDLIIHKRHHELTPGQNNEWNRLSDEIILAVYKWLPKSTLVKCARVCRRWSRLAFDETLWRRLDLANKTLKPGVIGRILDRGVSVLRLAKSEVRVPLYKDLGLTASPRVSRVQYLDMSMSSCSTEALEQLLGTCHYLKKLSLENCQINDNICRYIGQNTNLEVLNLCMCRGLTENGLVPICNNLQRLESLNVAWTDMSRGAVVYLVICLPSSLLKLNLSGCRQNLLDEDVQQLCRSCSHLKELDLSDATVLTCLAIEYIATLLRGLEYIALSRCYHVAPASLPILGQILTLLALDVFGMLKDMALLQLKQTMPNIEINKFPFSSIARPTTGIRRTSIWGLRVRDNAV